MDSKTGSGMIQVNKMLFLCQISTVTLIIGDFNLKNQADFYQFSHQKAAKEQNSLVFDSFLLGKRSALSNFYSSNLFNLKLQIQQQYKFSMNKHSNLSNSHTVEHSNKSNDEESSESDFSYSKTKKIQRRANKKKVTKIVHTYCFFHVRGDGSKQAIYYQQIGESTLKDPQGVKNLGMRQVRQHSSRMIQTAKKHAGFGEKIANETITNNQAQNLHPLGHYFQPAQYYYIY